ncbi:MAG: PAS domain S-box protein [Planctomycetota bacterium]|jgi:PAS domain S-box-containing protein
MKTEHKIIVGAIIAGLCLWLIDSCVDYFFFHDGLWEEILITKLSGHELFMRLVMLITLVSFGALVSLLVANRRSAEETLRRSEREFREMLENANLAAVILNEQGKIHFINNYLLALTGWKKEEVLGNDWFDIFIDEQNEDKIKQVYKEAVSGNIELVAYYENEIVTKNGERRLIAWNNAILHDSHGNTIGTTSIGEDITERRQTEDDLRDSRGKLNAMLESIPDQINMVDREFNIIWANKACEEVFGPGIIGKKCYEAYHNRTETCVYDRCIAARVFEDGQIHSHENQVTDRYGQIRHQLCTANVAFRDQEGNPTAVIEVSRDVTKRKEAEREIHNQKDFLENVIESLTHSFVVLDANDYTVKLANSATAKFGDISKDTTCYEFSHKNDIPCSGLEHRCPVEEVKKTKEAVTVEHIHLDDEDRERIVEVHAHPVFDNQGNVVQVIEYSLDITERKRIEESLKKSSIIINSTTDAVITTDMAGNITFWNKGAERIYSYQKEEVLGKPISIIYKEEDLHVLDSMISELMKGKDIPEIEVTCIDKNQKDVHILLSLTTLKDKDGNITELVGITKDITDRKQAEKELQESEEKYRSLFESAGDALFIMDVSDEHGARFIDCNNRTMKLFGCTHRDQIIGKSPEIFSPPTQPDGRSSHEKARELAQAVIQGQPQYFEWEHLRLDGTPFWVDVKLNRIEFKEKFFMQAIVRDITERKRMEEKLIKSEKLFSKAFYTSPIPGTITTVSNDTLLMVNNAWLRLFGFESEDQVIGKSAVELGCWADIEDREERNVNLQQSASSGLQEIRLRTPSGQIRHCIYTAELIDYEDTPHILSMAVDITERKQAEKEIERIFNMTNYMVCVASLDGYFKRVNSSFELILGYSSKELLSKPFFDFIHPDDVEKTIAVVKEKLSSGVKVVSFENRYRCKDGSYKWLSWTSHPVPEENLTYSIAYDITERKQAEEALKASKQQLQISEKHYRNLFTEMTGGFALHEILCDAGGKPYDYRFLETNRAFEEFTGLSAKNVIGKTVLDVLPNTESSWIEKYGKVALTGVSVHFEDYSRELNKYYDVIAYCPERGKFATVFYDITDRKQAEQALQISEERFRSLIEQAADAVVVHDFEGNIKIANRQACQMFGYTKDELLSKNISSFDPQVNRQDHRKNFWEKLRPNEHITIESVVYQKDGNKIPIEVRQGLIEIGSEKLVLGMARDISDRKEMEERERLRQAELVHMARLSTVGEMASAIAHELNQPLASISTLNAGAKRMMTSSPQSYSEEVIDAVNETANQARRAGKIISRIRDFTRKKTPNRSLIDINEIITESINFIEYELKNKQIRLKKSLTGNSKVYADPVQVEQVLLNLFRNALDAMDETDASKRKLTITTSQNDENNLQIAISDTGRGLKDEIINEIFQPFVTTKENGLGIGLSICRTIIERHDGHLWFDENHETGVTFKFTLPIERVI